MKISICIPTWEQYGRGVEFLKKNFEVLLNQTYSNFNVVISDHSKDDKIELLCNEYSKYLQIKFFKNKTNFGNSPSNTNNCIVNADGDIIKIIFQDDYLFDTTALELIVKEFENKKCEWLVCGCNHTYDDGITHTNEMVPRWTDAIKSGVNTISSPSVLSFRNINPCLFDENLTMLMDCDMYYQYYIRSGLPTILPNCLITNRIHKHQISNLYNQDITKEITYVNNKYH